MYGLKINFIKFDVSDIHVTQQSNYNTDKCHCSKLSTPTVHIYNQITVSIKYILYKTVVGALNTT